jgi:hypothetical protein
MHVSEARYLTGLPQMLGGLPFPDNKKRAQPNSKMVGASIRPQAIRPSAEGESADVSVSKRSYSSINITASGINAKRREVILENHS